MSSAPTSTNGQSGGSGAPGDAGIAGGGCAIADGGHEQGLGRTRGNERGIGQPGNGGGGGGASGGVETTDCADVIGGYSVSVGQAVAAAAAVVAALAVPAAVVAAAASASSSGC